MSSELRKRLEMRLRALAPGFARRAYRVAQAALARPEISRPLPEELVRDCRLHASRDEMLRSLPRGGAVCELGTLNGDFAARILDICAPEALHLVDIDLSRLRADVAAHPAVTLHETLTLSALAGFSDARFDWIYVDAGHDHASALADARAAAPKVRPGGYLVFNDFAHVDPYFGRYGVHRAVTDFCLESGWRLALMALQPAGLHDVALQRPGG